MLSPEESKKIYLEKGHLERISRVLDSEDNLLENYDLYLRLLMTSISLKHWEFVAVLISRIDNMIFAFYNSKRDSFEIKYRSSRIENGRSLALKSLQNYLHLRRLEVFCSILPLESKSESFLITLKVGDENIEATALQRIARQFVYSDLRARDREDDALTTQNLKSNFNFDGLSMDFGKENELTERFRRIGEFISRCDLPTDSHWKIPADRLFLSTRPPTYFDIASRWLSNAENENLNETHFKQLMEIVNAVRGTNYKDPVGVVNPNNTKYTIEIKLYSDNRSGTAQSQMKDPLLILGNLSVSKDIFMSAINNIPLLTLERLYGVVKVLEEAAKVARIRIPSLLVLPELSIPRQWFRTIANFVVNRNKFGLVTGLEYGHKAGGYVQNQVYAVLPGPFYAATTWVWTKRKPAHEESIELAKVGLSFQNIPDVPRTVIRSSLGSISVLICSEMIEAKRVADLFGRVNVVLCPAWNTDTSSYDHLIQSVGFQLHSIIAIANNGHYSDCRAWAPRSERWQRDLCRLIERDVDDIVHVNIPISSLVAFHRNPDSSKEWRPLPPDWLIEGNIL